MNLTKIKKNAEKNAEKNGKIIAINLLLDFFNIPLIDIIEKYDNKYFKGTTISKKEVFYRAMTETLTIENQKFLNGEGKKVGGRQSDKRTYVGYCLDLIYGWLGEDAVFKFLELKGLNPTLYGTDAERDFLNKSELSTIPDVKIGDNLIEIVFDWGYHWESKGKCDLRDNKYKTLVKEDSYLLGLAPKSKMGFIFKPTDDEYDFKETKAIWGFGNKPGYTIHNINEYMLPLDELFDKTFNIFR